MRRAIPLPSGLAINLLLAFTSTIQAHTWVEQLTLIASNGTFVGTPGYPRGFVPRAPGVDPDVGMTYLLPPNGRSTGNAILPSDLICKGSQTVGTQTQGYPPLEAAPGDQIAMIYQENGHVTQINLSAGPRPVGSGTVYIYGTKQSANTDTYLGIHRVWNTAGTGGDKRGKLVATRHFDDGQCFQNDTALHVALEWERRKEFNPIANDLKCQSDVQVPSEAGTSGTYTFYWVWEWPILDAKTGAVTQNESYTTCMDINMTPQKFPSAGTFDKKQVVDYAGIEEQLSTAFLVQPTIAEQLTGASGAQPTQAPVSGVSVQPSPVTSSGLAGGGLTTVTVTASPQVNTVTVTETVNGGTSQSTSTHAQTSSSSEAQTSTATISPLPHTASSSSGIAPSAPADSVPPVVPFLSPASQVSAAPAQESTLTTSATKASRSSSSATYTQSLGPSQSAVTYLNGSLHNSPKMRIRGRIIDR